MAEKDTRELSVQGVKRLPYYLKYLKELEASNTPYVPAAAIADSLGIYEVQVRKDLAAVSSQPGKPRVGLSRTSSIFWAMITPMWPCWWARVIWGRRC